MDTCRLHIAGSMVLRVHATTSECTFLCLDVFTCMTAVDNVLGQRSELAELLILLGVALWCVTAALELLRPEVQNETEIPVDN